ncbi:MAG: LAGLIDADG family homing endonuclease [Thermoproteota archaeon]
MVKYKDRHISFVNNLETITHTGNSSRILKIFRHPYEGEIIKIKPFYLPEIRVTANHKFFVFNRKNKEIEEVSAKDLNKKHLLLVPKSVRLNGELKYPSLNIKELLSTFKTKYRKARKVNREIALKILEFSSKGKTSREIGKLFDLHPAYVRRLLSDLRKHGIDFIKEYNENVIVEEDGRVRFKTERGPDIPSEMVVDEDFASLLGYYCAEGHMIKSKRRPSSYSLVFSLGKNEKEFARKIIDLLTKLFGVNGRIVEKRTNLEVTVYKPSLCRLFKLLVGEKSYNKEVPEVILRCENRKVINSFLKAYFEGDGYGANRAVQFNPVSKKLAINMFLLLMKLGFLPSFCEVRVPGRKRVEGRVINQRNLYYVKIHGQEFVSAFLDGLKIKDMKRGKWNKFFESSDYVMVSISKMTRENYKGYVYNLEVGNETHSYLCNFVAVSNCQNYDISKNQPDPIKARYVSPEQLVDIALRNGCEGTSISFNEPTLLLEYSLELFPLARGKGLYDTFVSNGYMTPNALEALTEAGLDAIKFDVKGGEEVYEKYCDRVKAGTSGGTCGEPRNLAFMSR